MSLWNNVELVGGDVWYIWLECVKVAVGVA